MAAMIELHIAISARLTKAALQTVMQSQRASVLEKQEAEIGLLRWAVHSGTHSDAIQLELRNISTLKRILQLEEILFHAAADQRRTNAHNDQLANNYGALIDDCDDVYHHRKRSARGENRKLSATEQLEKIRKIISEHHAKHPRMLVGAMTGAGSSTDH